MYENSLLIVTDTPDKKRVDGVDTTRFSKTIKIDHHPFIEDFGGLECINDKASSAAEIIMDLLENTKLECNKQIAETLYYGLISDSNRFLFNTCGPKTFELTSIYLEKYKFDILYNKNRIMQHFWQIWAVLPHNSICPSFICHSPSCSQTGPCPAKRRGLLLPGNRQKQALFGQTYIRRMSVGRSYL